MVTIRNIQPASSSDWDRLFSVSSVGTFFQSREWSEIWQNYTDGKLRPDPKRVEFSDGKSALLPLTYQRRLRGVLRKYWFAPGETYGGWLTEDALEADHAKALLEYLTTRLGGLFWKLSPYDPTAPAHGPHLTEYDETHVVPIRDGFDKVRARFSKGHRAAIKFAEREGVEVRAAESLADWEGYFEAYQDSLRRWAEHALIRHDWKLFYGMFQNPSPRVRLWLAEKDGEILGGSLCFYARNHVVYWHGAAHERHFPKRPMHALIHEILRDACDKGFEWFDMNPSGPLPGVKAFKKSFGAEARPCPNVRVRGGMWSEAARRRTGTDRRL